MPLHFDFTDRVIFGSRFLKEKGFAHEISRGKRKNFSKQ